MIDLNGRSSRRDDAQIDEALSSLAHSDPAEGLEQRIKIRLAGAGSKLKGHPDRLRPTLIRFVGGGRLWTRISAASVLAATVLLGSALVYHYGIRSPYQIPSGPVSAIHAPGFGPAAAIRVTPPAMRPSPPSHARRRGRAYINSHHKRLPAGVGLPRSPVLDQFPARSRP